MGIMNKWLAVCYDPVAATPEQVSDELRVSDNIFTSKPIGDVIPPLENGQIPRRVGDIRADVVEDSLSSNKDASLSTEVPENPEQGNTETAATSPAVSAYVVAAAESVRMPVADLTTAIAVPPQSETSSLSSDKQSVRDTDPHRTLTIMTGPEINSKLVRSMSVPEFANAENEESTDLEGEPSTGDCRAMELFSLKAPKHEDSLGAAIPPCAPQTVKRAEEMQPCIPPLLSCEQFGRFQAASTMLLQSVVAPVLPKAVAEACLGSEDLSLEACELRLARDFCTQAAVALDARQVLDLFRHFMSQLLEQLEARKALPVNIISFPQSSFTHGAGILELHAVAHQVPVGLFTAYGLGEDVGDAELRLIHHGSHIARSKINGKLNYRFSRPYTKPVAMFIGILFGTSCKFGGLVHVPGRETYVHQFQDPSFLITQPTHAVLKPRALLQLSRLLLAEGAQLAFSLNPPPVGLATDDLPTDAEPQSSFPVYDEFVFANRHKCLLHYVKPRKLNSVANPERLALGTARNVFLAEPSSSDSRAEELLPRTVAVKFLRSQEGIEAHRVMATYAYAPYIFDVKPMPGEGAMLVMEYVPGTNLASAIFLYMNAHPESSLFEVEAAFDPVVSVLRYYVKKLHKKGFLHGDLRAPNVIFSRDAERPTASFAKVVTSLQRQQMNRWPFGPRKQRSLNVWLVDFDWAGREGEVVYPSGPNPNAGFPLECKKGMKITREHDLYMLDGIVRFTYQRWLDQHMRRNNQQEHRPIWAQD